MKKKIKSAVISIIIIVVLLLSILIGVKNGTIDKLTKEMPTPVSYTHLDVYKRQDIDRSMTENVKRYRLGMEQFKEYVEMWIHEIKLPIASLTPVSYTHLDVYKRQGSSPLDPT